MDDFLYNQYYLAQKQELENNTKSKELFARLKPFEDVATLEEAKELAKQVIPTNQEYTSFFVGNTKCCIINKKDVLRISIDSCEEFICYDFS